MPDTRRILALAGALLALLVICPVPHVAAQDANAYAVVDATSGKVLLTKDANKKMAVGSLTNIATAMVVLDWLDVTKHDINELVPIPSETMAFPENPIGFQPGDQVSIKDLLYAALMQSDDIAGYSLAMFVGRNLPISTDETPMQAFVAQMNALARKLGMRSTLFVDATGMALNEKRAPYSTAGDMAQVARYAMMRSQFRFYVSQRGRTMTIQHEAAGSSGYALQNTNELLDVDAIDGVRTGTTRMTGPCVIISAAKAPESVQKGETYIITPRRLVVVVLGSGNRFDVAHQLLFNGWAAYDRWAAAGRPMRGG
jgi:serine-type D-Ala-D-Ala carboxypeptidase (penicillin-binding protein 5/6)